MSRPLPPPITGELVVVALKAENLQHQSPVKQDPFCVFRVADVVKRTKKDPGGGLYPIWDDQVNIPVPAGHHHLYVQVFDKDTNPANLMGEGVVDLSKVLREKEHDSYFPLQARGKPHCGDIYLELTFYSAVNTSRPQQQVRYQYPPGHGPGSHFPPPSHHQPHPPPQHRPQHRPPPLSQRPPPPPQQQQYAYNMPPQHHPMHSPAQHKPPPLQQRPLPQPPTQQPSFHQHPPPLQQQPRPAYRQQGSPNYHQGPPSAHHSPYPPSQTGPSPSLSISTQVYSPTMPSPQPLLSAPYNPVPSPSARPTNVNYPSPQRPPYPLIQQPYLQGPLPGGFHDSNQHRPPPPHQPGYYPPQPQSGMRPPPMAPNGYHSRPNNSYPPY